MKTEYVEVYRPFDQQQLMLIKMALERDGIRYFVANENLNSLLPPGGLLGLANMRLMVEESKAEDSLRIIREELGYL
jgi:hypothetical protein